MGSLWYLPKPAPTRPSITQEFPLMNLPPELRNMIWIYVAHSFHVLSVERLEYYKTNHVQRSPIIRVCKQIEYEFTGILHAEAPRFATVLHVPIHNFNATHLLSTIKDMPRPAPGVERRFVLHVTVDFFFDRNLTQLLNLFLGKSLRFNKADTLRHEADKD